MRSMQFPYEFSVIMAVYNTEAYLREAVDSLIAQTIGFDRIQLILADDGSTDGSGKVCDEYAAKYPGNVVVIHKENGGQASARNEALMHAQGRYVNFLDSDDKLSADAMEKAGAFMRAHENETDICCIPMRFFGTKQGEHPLNYKFAGGNRVIDLMQEQNALFFQMSAASAFYKADAARTMQFDTRHNAEDAKENIRILLNNPHIGIVSDTCYLYRKHGASTLDSVKSKKTWYLPQLKYFSIWALDKAFCRYGYVPAFVQHAVMYDLQWKVQLDRIPTDVLSPAEEKEFESLLFHAIRRIDDGVILAQKNLDMGRKLLLLGKKHGEPALLTAGGSGTPSGTRDLLFRYGERTDIRCAALETVWEFFSVDKEKNTVTLEGYHVLPACKAAERIAPCLLVNGQVVPCEARERFDAPICLGEETSVRLGFRAQLPVPGETTEIHPALSFENEAYPRASISFGTFFPASDTYRHMAALFFGTQLKAESGHLLLSRKPGWPARVLNECLLLAEIWKRNETGGRKAVAGRLFYHFTRPFKRRNLWILSDRIMKADDNGEALFLYLRKNPPPKTRVVFAISKSSPDAIRLSKAGKCVNALSFRHKLLHLTCDANISSAAEKLTVNPFYGRHEALRDLLAHQHYVFLQHGVTKDDISAWANRYRRNMSGFVAASGQEYRSLLGKKYAYPKESIWLTGFPRFDRLYSSDRHLITIMPTWRRSLTAAFTPQTGIWTQAANYTESAFYKFYDALLNNAHLLETIEEYGYRLQFFPHPNLRLSGITFHADPRVAILPNDTPYRKVFAESSLIVTDYSSAVFDFAYLRKPVLYCQFDRDAFFSGSHMYTKGYFDYERDGFGEVEYTLEAIVNRIIEYAKNSCMLKDGYRERIDAFFAYNDRQNCRRVTEKILALRPKQ